MKPITTTNLEGRALLALRAGPMTITELRERLENCSIPGWLIKVGYVVQDESCYRITEAGRAACPFRNPLAAPGAVQPTTFKPEQTMSVVNRQQVLAAIVKAGRYGTSPKHLIADFGCSDSVIYNHINLLGKQQPPVIFKPKPGVVCAIQFKQAGTSAPEKRKRATREAILEWINGGAGGRAGTADFVAENIGCTEESTAEVLRGLYASMKINRYHDAGMDDYLYHSGTPKMETQHGPVSTVNPEKAPKTETPAVIRAAQPSPAIQALTAKEIAEVAAIDLEALEIPPEAYETIELKDIPDRRSPFSIAIEERDFEAGVYSDGTLNLVFDDGLLGGQINFSSAALDKLRRFLGLFQEAA